MQNQILTSLKDTKQQKADKNYAKNMSINEYEKQTLKISCKSKNGNFKYDNNLKKLVERLKSIELSIDQLKPPPKIEQ